MSTPAARTLATHYELSFGQWLFSVISIVAACALVLWLGVRIAVEVDVLQWWVPVAVVLGFALADLASGLVHWFADTWGRDDMPVLGPRLLAPFRVHHINPDDLLRRPFVDANGDVAFLAACGLGALVVMPRSVPFADAILVGGFAFAAIGMWTNQIHQWAHMPAPPAPVRLLQSARLVLGHAAHARHHEKPWVESYCITTGWLNRPLEAVGFFRRLEFAITALTGARPRADDGAGTSRI